MKPVRNFFSFSKSEIRGLVVVLFLILVLISLRIILKQKTEGFNLKFQAVMDSTLINNSEITDMPFTENIPDVVATDFAKTSFPVFFDPNTAEYDELVSRGLGPYVARRIINYRSKGGRFSEPADLLKIYGIDSILVFELADDIQIHSPELSTIDKTKSESWPNKIKLDLNRADSIQLKSVYGIGSVLSARIVKYRNLLGGYYSFTQLSEVYGIDDSLYLNLASVFTIDTSCIHQIDLNNASINELNNHPYLTYYQAKAIMSYRQLVGPFKSKRQLTDNYLLSESAYLKVAPYLTLK